MSLLCINKLNAGYLTNDGYIQIVNNVSFAVNKGEMLGIAGESGSGKTTLVSAILNALKYPGAINSGSVNFNGEDILKMSKEKLRTIRGIKISYVPQGSMDSLNPVKKIRDQFYDIIFSHDINISKNKLDSVLNIVNLESNVLDLYPHQISGGMKQRVIIAMSLLYNPDLIVMDEPTTGLDVLVQYEIVKTIKDIQNRLNLSIIFITHDIALLFEIADRIMVFYGGEILELGNYNLILSDPKHPYTKLLLGSIPTITKSVDKLYSIPGKPIDFIKRPVGCVFSPRCSYANEECFVKHPDLRELDGIYFRCLRYPEWKNIKL